ncbi:MAG: ribosome maturation factor RimP [Deltaproteobacteria bacterium HGW-Deltaproteobacteria-19]|jgi:ribosome maturation factor RimP|nr:MAG: ribosome maturation factor RimP [Deltaproteobacteria bacterium HGW-Deltaproteobacteria-19]
MSGLEPTFFFKAMENSLTGRPIEEAIWNLAEPTAEAEGVELIHVECIRMKTRWIVRIFLDKAEGITVDDCTRVSHVLGDLLEVHDLPPGPYTLEVSSPGPNRPLFRDCDFVRFCGNPVMLRLDGSLEGRRNLRGTLLEYEAGEAEKALLVEEDGTVHRIPRKAVVKANLAEVAGKAGHAGSPRKGKGKSVIKS